MVDENTVPAGIRNAVQIARGRLAPVLTTLQRLWKNDRAFFVALTIFNLYLARNTFRAGIWADNDSVCHYAYLRHLLEEFYPATGTFFGWTPKYDLGAPFLVYNTPPGLYVAAGIVATVAHVSALAALKTVTVVAYLAVPLLGAALARTFEEEPRDLPKFTALALSLFSSELLGLEFYFKNGMLNPALGVPLALATLLCLRHAQRAEGATALRWVGLGALGFAATVFVHLLTTYMLVLTLGCFTFASGLRKFGRSAMQVATMAALGAGLVGFWLVPSLPFAAKEDGAYTWIRRPLDTLSNFLDGSLLSSYFVGFYPHFFTFSAVGLTASICAAFAVGCLAVRRNPAVAACAATALLALLVALGPRPSFGLWILPMYDRLLWYRFMTLASLMTLILAGWGAWRLWELRARLGPMFLAVVAFVALWSVNVVTGRAYKITTSVEGQTFVDDMDAIGGWLREHGKHPGRVYSEFLAENIVDSVSVNYPRHMMPVLSGFGEAGGWVYENDEAAQLLLKRGLFWYDPFPMIALAERYDVQYVVAGSPNFVKALNSDPRWRPALVTSHGTLFEVVGREPSLVEAAGWKSQIVHERYLRGGGYEYVVQLDAQPRTATSAEPAKSVVVKTSWSPAWRASAGDRPLTVSRSEDALVAIDLPPGATAATITLTWDISDLRARGNLVSLAALAGVVLLFGLGLRRSIVVPEGLWQRGGIAAAAVALVVLPLRAHAVDANVVGFGLRGGLLVTFDTMRADVGAFDDALASRLSRVLAPAWGDRELLGSAPARRLLVASSAAARITLTPVGANRVTVRGILRDASGAERAGAPIVLWVRDPVSNDVACRVEASLGSPALLPPECLRGSEGDGPGIQRSLGLEGEGTLVVSGIEVDNPIVVVEAETMHNVLDDSGYDAFYTMGPPDRFASNGVSMRANAGYKIPVALDREVVLPGPRYEAWILTRTQSRRLADGLAQILLEADGLTFADVEPRARLPLPFWDNDPHWEWLPAGTLDGGGTKKVRVTFHRAEHAFDGAADLDAMAFVPAGR
jgi:hypothetical protein